MKMNHALQALAAIAGRELHRFVEQRTRLLSSLVRPALWLILFAGGLGGRLDAITAAPYPQAVDYSTYIVPGLLGMILLFNGMQSSLALVYDREMGMMRLLLTAPLPRPFLLACKLIGGAVPGLLQLYVFLLICALWGIAIPAYGWLCVLPATLLGALMLGALGLVLSVFVRQLENFAGTMNFVIFPLFFLSSALHPLEPGATTGAWINRLSAVNPFTQVVELLRFALYGRLNLPALIVVSICLVLFFVAASIGYDPQRGMMKLRGASPN